MRSGGPPPGVFEYDPGHSMPYKFYFTEAVVDQGKLKERRRPSMKIGAADPECEVRRSCFSPEHTITAYGLYTFSGWLYRFLASAPVMR